MKRLLYLSVVLLFASCIKEPAPIPTGPAQVRFVNSVETSTPQDVYINGAKVPNSVPLIYGQYSPYVSITSGSNAFAFANTDLTTDIANAGIAGNINIGTSTTVFFFKKLDGDGGGLAAGVVGDDTTAVAGKAKIRFLHLNSFFDNFINFSVDGGAVLSEGIAFGSSSAYFSVDPGVKIKANGTGIATPLIIDAGLEAGKIYTIWIDGPSATELKSHLILQN